MLVAEVCRAKRCTQKLEVTFGVKQKARKGVSAHLVRDACSWDHFAFVPLKTKAHVCERLLDSRAEIPDSLRRATDYAVVQVESDEVQLVRILR